MIKDLNEALQGFRLDAQCVNARRHRHFAFYDIHLGPKCQVAKIRRLASEIALKICSRSIPIIKEIPVEGIVRLQVVIDDPKPIYFSSFYHEKNRPAGLLPFFIGETDTGTALWEDMAQNPHLLVAGSTGSGKSVFLHSLIANAVRTPNTILYLSDSKGVEFALYKNLGLVQNIARNYMDNIEMLTYLTQEMERRYDHLMSLGLQSIEQMKYPFDKIMVIIDEVSDIILMDGKAHKFERLVVQLAQKARAAGIYLVLATQRPSVDVLTGLIKANFEGRLAFRVSSRVDSQVILDHPGAELLVGRGDAIFKNKNHDSVRLQVAMTNPKKDSVEYNGDYE